MDASHRGRRARGCRPGRARLDRVRLGLSTEGQRAEARAAAPIPVGHPFGTRTRHGWAPALDLWAVGLLPGAGWCEAVVVAEEREGFAADEWPEHAAEESTGELAGAGAPAPVDPGAGDGAPALGASEGDAALDPGAGDGDRALAVALPAGFDECRLDECAASPRPVLNEICAVGTVQLLRVVRGEEAPVALEPLESVVVGDDRAHLYRLPDGGSWTQQGAIDAEHERPGSFGERNASAREATARP